MRALNILQLKREYDLIKGLRNLSGVGWDDATKKVKANPSVWIEYIKVRSTIIYMRDLLVRSLVPSLRVTQRQPPSARRGSFYTTRLASLSTALVPLESSRSGQAYPQALPSLGTRPLLHPLAMTSTLALTPSYWGFPTTPPTQPNLAPRLTGRRRGKNTRLIIR